MSDNRIIILNNLNKKSNNFLFQGFEFASGEYIGIIDSNDYVNNNIIENLYKLTKDGEFDIIRTNNYLYSEGKKTNKFKILNFLYKKLFNSIDKKNNFLIHSFIWKGIYKKELLNNIKKKYIQTTGISYKDISDFFKELIKSLNFFYKFKSFVYYRKINNNKISIINENINNLKILNQKEYYEFGKFFKKNTINNNYYFNLSKTLVFLENLNIINNKKLYIKYLYKDIYEILISNMTLLNEYNGFEKRFLKYFIEYGEEISVDIYINSKFSNIKFPKISIIMPIYNSESYIEECLNSIINQTFKNFEIICVNDGSNDNSLKILKEFENKDERIHIISQKNMGAGVARNIGIKESKGNYLIFLDSDDIFEKTMLEELYSKIKGNNVDVVICNSVNFKSKEIFFKKNYNILNNNINKIFSSFDIKKDFFNLFIWWPWDKIFNKKFIENLGIKFQNLKSTNDLYFIASSVITAKNISYIDKVFINHRVGIKTSIENSRDKTWYNFYFALKKLKKFLKEKELYKRFKQDFINYVASFSLWNLETIFGDSFCFLYLKLKNEWFNEFGVSKHNKNYFYKNDIYKKVKYILDTELEQIENPNEIDKNLYLINKQKFFCIPKVTIIIPIYNSQKYLSKSLNSIINQTLKEIEIICINDGSYDNSLRILNYYKKKDNRIIIFNQKNKGVNKARNLGLKNAKGRYILFFDSDDILKSDALEKLYNISKDKKLDVLYFNSEFIFENNKIKKQFPDYLYYKINIFNNTNKKQYLLSCNYQLINHLFLIKNNIKFFSKIKYDDFLFSFNLISKINKGLEMNETFYYKIFDNNSIKKTDKLIKKIYDYIITLKELIKNNIIKENENINNQKFELFIDNLESLIFYVFNKIEINKFILFNHFTKKEKLLLLIILLNKKNDRYFIENIYKKKDNYFYLYTFLFNSFEKKNCFKLIYKIYEFKNIFIL